MQRIFLHGGKIILKIEKNMSSKLRCHPVQQVYDCMKNGPKANFRAKAVFFSLVS